MAVLLFRPEGPAESSTRSTRLQSRGRARAARSGGRRDALHAALAGRPIVRAEAPAPLAVRGTPAELRPSSASGSSASGAAASSSCSTSTGTALPSTPCSPAASSSPRPATSGRRIPPWSWRSARARARRRRSPRGPRARPGCPADEAEAEIRYRDPSQMGKVYLLPAGVPAGGRARGCEQGPDADDPGADARGLARAHPAAPGRAEVAAAEPGVRGGIGNAYSDEILHAAKLSPFRRRSSLAPEEVDALYAATRATLVTRSGCCGNASRRRSRSRSATSSPSTCVAARPAHVAARASARSARGARRRPGAGAARSERDYGIRSTWPICNRP